jgi:hypothetical protein
MKVYVISCNGIILSDQYIKGFPHRELKEGLPRLFNGMSYAISCLNYMKHQRSHRFKNDEPLTFKVIELNNDITTGNIEIEI